MHLILIENEEEKECTNNKYESMFCPMERLSKQFFVEKWKSIPAACENKFIIGKLYTNKETSVIKRLQAHNIIGCAFKTVVQDKITNLYMSCTTKDNILIVAEIVLVKSNHLYAEIKYRSESKARESDLEKFLVLILSDCDQAMYEEQIGR